MSRGASGCPPTESTRRDEPEVGDWTGEPYQQTISGTTKTFASDRYGNLTTAWDKASASITYAYDEASRLTTITPQTGSAATLTPDALDRSKSRVVGSTTDTYGYLGPSTTSYETGSTTKTDALLDVDGSRLAVKTGSTLSWVIFDLHGSIVALCPAGSTTLSDAYRYDAWGQAIGTNPGSATNPWRYRGLLDLSPDSTNPILSMGARFYSPQLGTFTQEDSVQGQAANPLSMNRYLYAEADPETLIDPDGHGVDCEIGQTCDPVLRQADTKRLREFTSKQQATYQQQVKSKVSDQAAATKAFAIGYGTPQDFNPIVPAYEDPASCSSCVTDATGYTYDPYGDGPWGGPFPFACVGSPDVRACLTSINAHETPGTWGWLGTGFHIISVCAGGNGGAAGFGSGHICFSIDTTYNAALTSSGGTGSSTGLMANGNFGIDVSTKRSVSELAGEYDEGGVEGGDPPAAVFGIHGTSDQDGTWGIGLSFSPGADFSFLPPAEPVPAGGYLYHGRTDLIWSLR